MVFQSKQIKGNGRGRGIGFPTINLVIPHDFSLDEGIYAVWVIIDNITFKGALHYGPVPTFGEKSPQLEVHLVDVGESDIFLDTDTNIEIDVVDKLRDIKNFINTEDLIYQIDKDVEKVRNMLKS